MNIVIQILIIFLLITFTVFLFINRAAKQKIIRQRVKELIPEVQSGEEVQEEKSKKSEIKGLKSLARVFQGMQFSNKTNLLLLESGSLLKPEEFYALRILISIIFACLLYLLGQPWYFVLVAFIIGFSIPKLFLSRKRKKRLNQLTPQLIETLGIMANSMRAGYSFMQAIQLVGSELSDPIGPEFERVVRETGLGVPLEEVFEQLIKRLPNKELEVVVQAILAQRKSGGNLAELLETMGETVRGRLRVTDELKTLTAQGRMSSWIITLLPVGVAVYLYFMGGDYFKIMLDNNLGLFMIGISVISNVIGWLLIQKIIKIEV